MTIRTRRTPRFVPGLLLIAAVSAGFGVAAARPQGGTSKPAGDASEAAFVSVGRSTLVNPDNIIYMSDGGGVFDVYFACSSARSPAPLRLTDANEINHIRSYFNDDKRHAKKFERYNKNFVNARQIAFIEYQGDSVVINFNARIAEAFVQLTLTGADAESFRARRRES